jgi:molecular chaperone GrpE
MQNHSDEHEDGEIIQVLQKGYKFKERLLRPAMINICKKA